MVMREAATLLVAGLARRRAGGRRRVALGERAALRLRPGDPLTLAPARWRLTLVAMLASYVPAWRASRLEPTVALREE